ncbi:tRNA (N(6)-L-threonylcarbamoyladenosine(37)-C(2))-methylthiotransferase [Candidatus Woesearchaeota archaeon]|nr:tRNA (N(6)-L-threonylcarbamoyladenosine(37)-C(2))-methylthiotransferase [Candidatus Woesearchaeota archaeon]
MKQVFIKTYGCAVNQSDSEVMAGLLTHSGRYKIVDALNQADIVIVNSCTVKQSSERKFLKYLGAIRDKLVILAGCVPQAETDKKRYHGYSIIGTSQITKVTHVLDEAIKSNTIHLLSFKNDSRLNLPKIRKNQIIEIVPVSDGCLGNCTYCKVKQARGSLLSYEKKEIIRQIKSAVQEGIKEVWLTSQDMGCYGLDIKTNLIELLKEVVAINGNFYIRIGMANPNYILPMLNDLIKIYKNEKIFKFLHIPVQSGNNRILGLMNRKYTVQDFKKIIYEFRKQIPEITISTDIICGFPTETKKDFNDSLELIKEAKPDVLNISRFWPRPGTRAEKLKQIPGWETKNRSRKLSEFFDKISVEKNKRWLGWKGEALIDEFGKNNTLIGRNYAYKQIIIKGDYTLGKTAKVKINNATKHDLRGEVLNINND